MLPLLNTLSRSDADVIASLLHAHGINFHIGSYCHNSCEIQPIAFGGHNFTVVEYDFTKACNLIRSIEDIGKPYFNKSLQKIIVSRLLYIAAFLFFCSCVLFINDKEKNISNFLLTSVVIGLPVNTQASRVFYFSLNS